MNNSIIAYNPCGKCEKDKCNICELNMYRQGTLKKDKWISVEDSLPPKHELVLTFYDCERIRTDFITIYGCWFDESLYGKPTHWMPLPQKPKMKGAE